MQTPFLVDAAADRTVLSADIFEALGLVPANIIDRPNDTVCLLGQQHYYTIVKR